MANETCASVFPAAFISQILCSRLQPYLSQIALATSTEIEFNYDEQRFLITGTSTEACDDALANIMRLIETSGSNNVGEDGLSNTYESLPPVDQLSTPAVEPSTPLRTISVIAVPDPASVEVNVKMPPAESKQKDEDVSDTEKMHIQIEKATFTFAMNVRNVQSVLSPPHLFSQINTEYMYQIAKNTDTTCTLEDRTIVIVGNTEKDVKAAEQRFQMLQAVYKRMKKYNNCKPVPVTHSPTKFDHFGLVFCHLPRYAHLDVVDLHPNEVKPMQTFFVLIPTFKDSNGKYMQPKLMVDAPPSQNLVSTKVNPTSNSPLSLSSFDADELNVASPMSDVSAALASSPPMPLQSNISQFPLLATNKDTEQTKEEDKSVGEWNKVVSKSLPPTKLTSVTPQVQSASTQGPSWPQVQLVDRSSDYWHNVSEPRILDSSEEAFPPLGPPAKSLPNATVASSGRSKDNVGEMNRRYKVMQLSQAPSIASSPDSELSPVEALRAYNFNTIYATLHEAFEDVQGCRGDFRFSASLGKVLWTNIKPEAQQQVWEYTDLRDIVQNQYGATPQFNNVTTTSEEIINSIAGILPQPFGRTAHYEIIANARNQPHNPYSEVNMKVNANIIDLEKVTVCNQTIAEVDWVSLDRKFDFSFKLVKKEQLRTDIKPFSTFIRKVSMSVKTRNITFQNIPDFLDVKQILFKQTQRFRLHYPFIVEITRVELLPLQRQGKTSTILGHTGKGEVWFDFEVLFNEHCEHFKENLKLPIGTLASWTADDMLGPKDTGAKFVEMVKCMLLFVEQSHRVC